MKKNEQPSSIRCRSRFLFSYRNDEITENFDPAFAKCSGSGQVVLSLA